MLRNIVAGKAAIGPLNTSNGEIITVLTPRRSLWPPILKSNDYKSYLKLETPLYLAITY